MKKRYPPTAGPDHVRPNGSQTRGSDAQRRARLRRLAEMRIEGKTFAECAGELRITERAAKELAVSADYKRLVAEELDDRKAQAHAVLHHITKLALMTHVNAMKQKDSLGVALTAAESVLDRVGLIRTQRIQQHQTHAIVPQSAFAGRSTEDLEFFAEKGYWPEEQPSLPLHKSNGNGHALALPSGGVDAIDAELEEDGDE